MSARFCARKKARERRELALALLGMTFAHALAVALWVTCAHVAPLIR